MKFTTVPSKRFIEAVRNGILIIAAGALTIFVQEPLETGADRWGGLAGLQPPVSLICTFKLMVLNLKLALVSSSSSKPSLFSPPLFPLRLSQFWICPCLEIKYF
jgi:hypothetical protein